MKLYGTKLQPLSYNQWSASCTRWIWTLKCLSMIFYLFSSDDIEFRLKFLPISTVIWWYWWKRRGHFSKVICSLTLKIVDVLTLFAASKKTLGIIRCFGTPWHKEIGLDVTTRSCQVVCENEDGENNEKRQGLVIIYTAYRLGHILILLISWILLPFA